MARSSILTPIALSEPIKAGRRRFWKQILPVTDINYDGQKISFDKPFHMDLADAFSKNAFDQVPVVFADAANGHNMDPRNFAGDVLKTEYRGEGKGGGTWALIEADKEGARAIQRNPKLGVSARIKQGIEKADGRFFKRAINHVLLTMNPRVTGMSPWQAVDLSEDADIEVVDLTAAEYTEGTAMGKTANKGRRQPSESQIDLSALSDDEFKDLLLDMSTEVEERGIAPEDLEDEGDEEIVPPSRHKKSKVKTTKVVERESEDDGDEEDEGDEEDGDADLSERVVKRNEVSQFGQMRKDIAQDKWTSQREGYLRAGVPAFLLDLAEPVLSQPDAVTLDLSEDEDDLDVSDVITQMLDGVKSVVDMTGEIGTAIDLSEDTEDGESVATALLTQWESTYSA